MICVTQVWALFRTAYPSKSRRMHPTLRWLLCCHKIVVQLRTLSACEKRYSAFEKETTAIIEAVRKWLRFVKGRHFTIVTDQEAVSFMFSQTNLGKIKNAKIVSWRVELRQLHYDIRHKPDVYNVGPDALSRSCVLGLSANCANHSDTLDMHDFTTLLGNAICRTPARRQKLYVDRAELALKLSRLFRL